MACHSCGMPGMMFEGFAEQPAQQKKATIDNTQCMYTAQGDFSCGAQGASKAQKDTGRSGQPKQPQTIEEFLKVFGQ